MNELLLLSSSLSSLLLLLSLLSLSLLFLLFSLLHTNVYVYTWLHSKTHIDPYSWIGQGDGRIFFFSVPFCCPLRSPSVLLMDERAQLHNSIYRETNLWMFRKLFVFVCLFMAGTHIGMPGPLTSLERHPPPSAAHSLVCKIRVKITSINQSIMLQ